MPEAKFAELMDAALNDLNMILMHYIDLMAEHGLSPEQIIEILKDLGYAWC